MDPQTYENVLTALRREAVEHARYLLFAAAARRRGEARIAAMFEGIAAVELEEHFAGLAELAELIGTDPENVRTAILDENRDVALTYPRFAGQARGVGEFAVAERFEQIAEDEREHEKTLEQALERLEVPA